MSKNIKHEKGIPRTKINVFSNVPFNILNPETKFNLTGQENCQRIRKYANGKTYIQYTRIHCTSCNRHLGSAMANFGEAFVHPLLKVLICKLCLDFYQSSNFVKDKDGKERYCRWCGQGGTLVCCPNCPMVFCKTCIKNNFNKAKYFEIISNDEWKCFNCDASQLSTLRMQCYAFKEYCLAQMSDPLIETMNPITKLIDYSTCCVSNHRPHKRLRSEPIIDDAAGGLLKIIKLSPDNWPTLSKYNIQAVELSGNETKSSTTTGASVVWDSKHGSVDNNVGESLLQPKPFALVSLPPFPGSNMGLINAVPQAQAVFTNDPPTLALGPAQQPHPTSLTGQHFLYRSDPHTPCQVRSFNSIDVSEKKAKQIDRTIKDSALANSTFASAILQLSQMINDTESLHQHIEVYNSLQECLNTCVVSLEQIKGYLTENYSGIGSELNQPPHTFKLMQYHI